MNQKWIVVLLTVMLLLTACRAVPMNQVIEEDIPFNVKEVIHTEKVKDGVILLYATRQKNEKREEFDAVTVAFLKGNDRDGWENAGHNHWNDDKDDRLKVFKNIFYDYNGDGELENKIPVIYGKIEDNSINSVEVIGNEGLERAYVIKKESGRYFIKVGDYESARGLSGNERGVELLN
ncbi:hypothetical protein [Cytobacillus sp.]|uniref:hypothetical protein n=1 Tax=Cytobacillus sp. TaxID=2675269 RepID=UPI0028BD7E4C|nr:hypothetical protein [Cytobacillus sp.]